MCRQLKRCWIDKTTRYQFLDEVAKKLKIQKPSDWGRVKSETFSKCGGAYLLNLYGGSMYNLLQNVYKGGTIVQINCKILNGKKSGFQRNVKNIGKM